MNNDDYKFPLFDDQGINIADPHDKRGNKTNYISLLQARALQKYVGSGTGKALDIGCGYGRMCSAIANLGYSVTGVEPSERVLQIAAAHQPQYEWHVGALPDLPFSDHSFDLVCLFNVARPLHLMQIADMCRTISRLVKPGGKLVIIDNLRKNDSRYLPEQWFNTIFEETKLKLVCKTAIRSSRWPVIYMIRYGFIPESWFNCIADWEIRCMAKKKNIPQFSYYNYIFIYEKN